MPNVQMSPDVAFGAGNYYVVWSDARDNFYYRIYGSRVSPAGTVLDPAGVQLGPTNNLYQYYPAVAFDGTRFLCVWEYGTSPYQIMGRFINSGGTLADTVKIATPAGYVYTLRLVFNGSNYMVAWSEYSGSQYQLKGLRLTTAGVPIGSPFIVATGIELSTIGLRWDGYNYLFTYSQSGGSVYQIFGQFYTAAGVPSGSAFRISNSTYSCYYGDMIPGPGNRYLNVWTETRANYDIYGNIDVQVGIDEGGSQNRTDVRLKSTVVTNAIELIGQSIELPIYDSNGRLVGRLNNGKYDCSGLNNGVYFLKLPAGPALKVVKIK